MEIQAHKNLTDLHTFGVPWKTAVFCAFENLEDVQKTVAYAILQKLPIFVLGGGSNILPTVDYAGLVIKNELGGRSVLDKNDEHVSVCIGAGEDWHALVGWAVESGYYGLENLALIPGTVGGAVVQNIGAYDVDLARFVQSVDVINLHTGQSETLTHAQCEFEYRNSVFKKNQGQWIITRVTLQLQLHYTPVTTYKLLREKINHLHTQPTAVDVMNAVIEIRKSKLPDWNTVGTAGSFFGNPRVDDAIIKKIREKHPDVPVFSNYGGKEQTIPAGWLIEHCRLDKKIRAQYLYPQHSLVLVNNHKATGDTPRQYGKQIHHASKMIANRVKKDFGVQLIPEVIVLE